VDRFALHAAEGRRIIIDDRGVASGKEGMMRTRPSIACCVAFVLGLCGLSALASDSIYGKVTAVRSPDVVVFNYGTGEYVLRIIGIDPPSDRARATDSRRLLSTMVLNKRVRMRLERKAPNGDMYARLYTDDPAIGIKDVGLELIRAGLARRQPTYDGKYGEMAAAESEARAARRGLWAQAAGKQ
jgi:endonuclease YncB( thermonuclease family)